MLSGAVRFQQRWSFPAEPGVRSLSTLNPGRMYQKCTQTSDTYTGRTSQTWRGRLVKQILAPDFECLQAWQAIGPLRVSTRMERKRNDPLTSLSKSSRE